MTGSVSRGMAFGGTGTKISPTARGDNAGKGPLGIEGFYIFMWRGYAVFVGEARAVKAVDNG